MSAKGSPSAGTTSLPPTSNPTLIASKTVWELPGGSWSFVPTSRPLQSEEGYTEWALSMRGALEYATLWSMVSGSDTAPSGDLDALALWQRRDGAARAMIIRALGAGLVTQVQPLKTAKQYWDTLAQQYLHTSLTSAVTWFRNLVTPLHSLAQLEEHIQSFVNSISHIKSAGFDIPEPLAVGLFLSTLVEREGEATQWDTFTAKISLTVQSTLNEILTDVRNERRHLTGIKPASSANPDTALSTIETALATLELDARRRGSKWCRYCKCDGHWGSECRSKGNANKPRVRGRKKGINERSRT